MYGKNHDDHHDHYKIIETDHDDRSKKGDWKWKLDSMKKDIEQFQELRKKELEEQGEQAEDDHTKFGLANVDSELEEKDVELIPPVIRTLFDRVYHMFLVSFESLQQSMEVTHIIHLYFRH